MFMQLLFTSNFFTTLTENISKLTDFDFTRKRRGEFSNWVKYQSWAI